MPNESWSIRTASDDILNFIVYIGCAYGLIDEKKYKGKEILWPQKHINADVDIEEWEEWFKDIVDLEVERINAGKYPYAIIEEYLPPEFLNVKSQKLQNCCKDTWPKFQEWWYMLGGGKNALNFTERILHSDLNNYVSEVEKVKGRKLKPFNLYISLLYTGLSETIEINLCNNQYLLIAANPFIYFKKEWWIKKLDEIG